LKTLDGQSVWVTHLVTQGKYQDRSQANKREKLCAGDVDELWASFEKIAHNRHKAMLKLKLIIARVYTVNTLKEIEES